MSCLRQMYAEPIKKALSLPDEFAGVKDVMSYLLKDSRGTAEGGKATFDHIKDYRYVYPSFKQLYNVDLNKDNISWWEYKTMLEGCFFSDCMVKSVSDIRNRKIPPKANAEVKSNLSSLKHKYMLRTEEKRTSSLFESLKGVAKNGS